MGLIDTVIIDAEIELPRGEDPTATNWQSKDIDQPMMQTYRLSTDGRLLAKETHRERRSDEEIEAKRAEYEDRDIPYMDTWDYKTVHDGWRDTNWHGAITIHSSRHPAFDHCQEYEIVFTNGQLEQIRDQGDRFNDVGDDFELAETVYYDYDAPLYERFSAVLIDDVLRTISEHHDLAADAEIDALVDQVLDHTGQTNRTAVTDCVRSVLGYAGHRPGDDRRGDESYL